MFAMRAITQRTAAPISATNSSTLESPHAPQMPTISYHRTGAFKGIGWLRSCNAWLLIKRVLKRFSMASSIWCEPFGSGDGAEPAQGSVDEPEVIGVRIALVHSQFQLMAQLKIQGVSAEVSGLVLWTTVRDF